MRGYVPVSCISKNVAKNKDDNSIKSYELSSLKDSLPAACLVRDGCSCRKRLEGEIFFSAKYLSRNWYAWWKRLEGEMFFSVWYLFGLGQSVVTILKKSCHQLKFKNCRNFGLLTVTVPFFSFMFIKNHNWGIITSAYFI